MTKPRPELAPRAAEAFGSAGSVPATPFDHLGLAPHPEGGAYRELFRSAERIRTPRGERSALTVIHFRIERAAHTSWHRVPHDELWQFVAGDPIELMWIDAQNGLEVHVLSGFSSEPGSSTLAVVPAGRWQCARALGDATLVTCTLGPGFEFEDFELLRDVPTEAGRFTERHPELAQFI